MKTKEEIETNLKEFEDKKAFVENLIKNTRLRKQIKRKLKAQKVKK